MNLHQLDIDLENVFSNIDNDQLADINLIVGKNSIGKTHLFQKLKSDIGENGVLLLSDKIPSPTQLSECYDLISEDISSRDIAIKLLTAIDENLVDVVTDDGEIHLQVSWCSRLIPLSEMGGGFQRLFGLVVSILTTRNKIFIIDDIEKGVHHSVMGKVWSFVSRVAQDNDLQVFVSTHSLDCLLAFYEAATTDCDRTYSIARLGYSARNSSKGEKIATMYKNEDIKELKELGIDLR